MKKIFALLLAAMLVLTAFSGCSTTNEQENSNLIPVIRVGETEYTLNDINYMYVSIFNQIYTQLYYYVGTNISSYVDVSKDLKEQYVDEEQTWHDYIVENIKYTLGDMTALYLAAKEEGFELDEEYQTNLDNIKSDLEAAAEDYGTNLEGYITAMYGPGMDYDTIYKMSEISYYASAYGTAKEDSIEVTEEEMRAVYEENKNDYDTVNFRFCALYYADDIEEYTDDDVAEYNTKAQAIANTSTEDEFKAAIIDNVSEDKKETYEIDSTTLYNGASYADVGYADLADWLFDSQRKNGDTYVYEDEANGGFIPVMFLERVSADYNPVDVRHILVMPEEDDEGIADDEAWAAAEKKANEILAQFNAGEKTEESFATMAEELSEDGGSNSNGGLYSNILKGQMIAPFENWCFDESRQAGDTGIVKTDYGYHIMYFSAVCENNIYASIKSTVVDEKFDSWLDSVSGELTIEELESFEQVGGMIATIAEMAEEHANAESESSEAESEGETETESEASTDSSSESEESASSEESSSED